MLFKPQKKYYLTFNESPSGVYISQVIDVLKIYKELGHEFKLISFVSFKNYTKARNTIKSNYKNSIVLPLLPMKINWKLNKYLLRLLFSGSDNFVITRGVFSANLCFLLRKCFSKIIYDGRGAVASEHEEYLSHQSAFNTEVIKKLEEKAVLNSDFRIAVSNKLVEYWNHRYEYRLDEHLVVPCVSSTYSNDLSVDEKFKLPWLKDNDILLVYSGGLSGWQSFETIKSTVVDILNNNKKVKILFLSKENEEIHDLIIQFPERIFRKWVAVENVDNYLIQGDYGILIRDDSITNKVSSPVKFSEYLSCGLSIIISENVGDYSSFVKDNNCGLFVNQFCAKKLTPLTQVEKEKNIRLAKVELSKKSILIIDKYKKIASLC